MVTITEGGRVFAKIVTGSGGYNAGKVARKIRETGERDLEALYEIAKTCGFGGEPSLVVIGRNEVVYKGFDPDDLDKLYFSTLDQPKFNPRWECGEVEHLMVVRLENCGPRPCKTCETTFPGDELGCPECGIPRRSK